MNREEILEKIIKVISNNLYIEEGQIQEEDRIREDIGADSLDKVSLFMDFEAEFNISIPDEDVEEILTIKEIIDYLETKI